MSHKSCFVYLCSAFPIIGILCFTSVVLYICVMLSLLLVFYVSQPLFCISLFWFPYNLYFMSHKSCFVYLCSAFPIIGILCLTSVVLYICVMISPIIVVFYVLFHNWYLMLFCISVMISLLLYFMFHKSCFVYLCYDFPIIGILYITSVVLYICVMISLLLVFYVSQALFCISVLWFPYNLYFMFYKSCFVYLCSAFPIIGILCITRVVLYIFVMISLLLVFYVSQALFCISVLWFPYYCYFMYHKGCFVYLCSAFPIIGILCFTSVVLYIFVMISLLLVFYVSQALFCISVLWLPYIVFYSQGCFVYLCSDFLIIGMYHKRCFVYLCYDFPIIGILCFTSVVLYICVMISL